jgi:hypothetical protein
VENLGTGAGLWQRSISPLPQIRTPTLARPMAAAAGQNDWFCDKSAEPIAN